tara:strand:- start:161 stop:472 length:312 start_codon:yes stop_codon:yes gene_type:complete
MNKYIVTVTLADLDHAGIEAGFVGTLYVPTIAKDEDAALRGAVVYHSDNGEAQENDLLQIECKELERKKVWVAERALKVSDVEWETFLSITQSMTSNHICKPQ